MLRDLIERVRGVLARPRHALPLTLADSGAPRAVFWPYVAILAALGPVALFLCDGVLGSWEAPYAVFNDTIPGSWTRAPLEAGLKMMLGYGMSVGCWAGLATLLWLLAPAFGGLRDRGGAAKAAAYAMTPVWLAGATFLLGSVPHLTWLPGVALVASVAWAAFVGTLAVPLHLGTPEARAPGHALAALGITAVLTTGVYYLISSAIYAIWSSRLS